MKRLYVTVDKDEKNLERFELNFFILLGSFWAELFFCSRDFFGGRWLDARRQQTKKQSHGKLQALTIFEAWKEGNESEHLNQPNMMNVRNVTWAIGK